LFFFQETKSRSYRKSISTQWFHRSYNQFTMAHRWSICSTKISKWMSFYTSQSHQSCREWDWPGFVDQSNESRNIKT